MPITSVRALACILCVGLSVAACGGRRSGRPPAPTDASVVGTDARVDGASGQICSIGEVRCRDTYNVEACSPGSDLVTLEWVNAITCMGGQVCVSGACVDASDGGSTGCPSVTAIAACQTEASTLCERIVACCTGGAAWCEPYATVLSSVDSCLSVLSSDPSLSCDRFASDPSVCETDVAVCTTAYRGLTCDAIGSGFMGGGGFDVPPGC